jgi:hypothetical protein
MVSSPQKALEDDIQRDSDTYSSLPIDHFFSFDIVDQGSEIQQYIVKRSTEKFYFRVTEARLKLFKNRRQARRSLNLIEPHLLRSNKGYRRFAHAHHASNVHHGCGRQACLYPQQGPSGRSHEECSPCTLLTRRQVRNIEKCCLTFAWGLMVFCRYSRHRVTLKKRYGLLITQQSEWAFGMRWGVGADWVQRMRRCLGNEA